MFKPPCAVRTRGGTTVGQIRGEGNLNQDQRGGSTSGPQMLSIPFLFLPSVVECAFARKCQLEDIKYRSQGSTCTDRGYPVCFVTIDTPISLRGIYGNRERKIFIVSLLYWDW